MTSSMLAGERRWASARRGGMTVLGKVAVPKPINLPSQRLENHGLDPNVEIVPKGTHNWGSKSSSSTSNAWGTSSLSPNANGCSPSLLSGRPSSGESGTRPSTAGSDVNHEPVTNVSGLNSRPSSASGALTSNQASLAASRPRSAETRPGSSQLSRFAEPLPDNSVAWGASSASEKLGMKSSKIDGFSLISGDFPTLGSEKELSGRNPDSQDHSYHSRPSSSSGVVTAGKERIENSVADVSTHGNFRSETATSLRKADTIYGEDQAQAGVEKWHGDPQLYPYSNIPPQHYDAWCVPPVNNHPGGVWYRGPSGGSNFGPPVASGGFPMDPFPYYRPQMPQTAIANKQPVPPPGAGPRRPHQENGEMLRPNVCDPYDRTGMPVSPGVYPGHVPHDAYYGPPMGYYGASERNIALMTMAIGPTAFNGYSGQDVPDSGNPRGRYSGFGPDGKSVVSEQEEPGNPQEARGPYKVLLKQHDGWERKDEQNWNESVTINASGPGGAYHPMNSSWESGRRGDNKDERMRTRKALAEEALEAIDNEGGMALKARALETVGNAKSSDEWPTRKLESADHSAFTFHEVLSTSKDPSLIQKIEGLNAEARASDGKLDVKSTSHRLESNNTLQVRNARTNNSREASGMDTGSLHRTVGFINSASHEDHATPGDRSLQSTAADGILTTRSASGMHGRADYHGSGRLTAEETGGFWRKSQVTDRPGVVSSDFESASVVCQRGHTSVGPPEKSRRFLQEKDGESLPPVSNACDSQAQVRAKMREVAMQHQQQREREEKERTRDQKAKALAKLEELNRRTEAGDGIISKLETVLAGGVVNKKNFVAPAQSTLAGNKSGESNSTVVFNRNANEQGNENSVAGVEKSTTLSIEVVMQAPKPASVVPVLLEQSESLRQDVVHSDSSTGNRLRHVPDNIAAKQNHMGYRQKLKSPSEKNPTEKLISTTISEACSGNVGVTAKSPVSYEDSKEIALNIKSRQPVNPIVGKSSTNNGKMNKSVKSKQRVGESLPAVIGTPALENVVQSDEQRTSEPKLDPGLLQPQTDSKDVLLSSEQRSPVPNEEVHTHLKNQRKYQHAWRLPRTMHANKLTEKFQSGDAVVWAPVRSQKITQVFDAVSQKTAVETFGPSIKIHQPVQNSLKNKRAELERYIPKPFAKEMAQQGSNHQSWILPAIQVTPDQPPGRPESGCCGAERSQTSDASVAKVGSNLESKKVEDRQNRPGKMHGSWHQRGSVEPTDSNESRNAQKSTKHHQLQKSSVISMKDQPRYSDEWNATDGWNIPEEPIPAVVTVVKEQGMTARGKRQSYNEHRSAGHNHDSRERRINSGDIEKVRVQSSSSDMVREDASGPSKENRDAAERLTSHWQPKSHHYLAINQRGSRLNGGQDGVEPGAANKKNSGSQGVVSLPHEADKVPVVRDEQIVSEKRNLVDTSSMGPREAKKVGTHKGHPGSPPESPSKVDGRSDQYTPLGFCKDENQNSHFGLESHGEWTVSRKDNKQHNVNRERQRHYEYQPVGPHNTTKANELEPPKDGSSNSGPRFRQRSQSHSRRGGGNFQGRKTNGVRLDGRYD
ncbi:hypothetical protein K2173_026977 [Erythroxylum novogranatense]|uniref:BAT2 N-terminal domain-containing protein n=1 Tax=Erythroxylum novogranatense TaxID=1862640 RepID=A0AAV8U093_9ROSI|nr:hypothetical protein K2173_026977 [Erythroxylum novogranatense]